MSDKIKVLWYSDTPTRITGFGNVARNVLKHLHATGRYEFEIQAINGAGWYNRDRYPYIIHPAGFNPDHDVYGTRNFRAMIAEGGYVLKPFDILFTLHNLAQIDPFVPDIKAAREGRRFSWIDYSPLDVAWSSERHLATYYEADYPVCYTQFAYDTVCKVGGPSLAPKLRTIYHGTEPETFFPIPGREELKKRHFDLDPGTFLVVNVNRNQWRKDLARTMAGFKLWKERYGHKAVLYLHAKISDLGGNLIEQACNCGLDLQRDIIFSPPDFNTFGGVSPERLNEIYNAADCIVSTTNGEGWGLSTTEAFCTQTPVLMPRNTSLVEIVGADEERGWLCGSGTTASEWCVGYGQSDMRRPLVNVESFADKLEEIYQGDTEERVMAAYRWALEHTWEIVCEEWIKLFREASSCT